MRCPNNPRHVFPIHIKDIPLEKPFGCIYCSGKKPFPGETDLFTLLPIAKEMWNDKKPGRDLTAINPRSREKVSFKCTVCGHEFDRRIRDFYLKDHSCPKCKRLRNSVAKCAKLMNQWDFEANAGIDPNEYNVSCDTEVGWKCKECGYKWRSKISSRYASQGLCPSHEVRIAICEGTNALVDLVPEILLDFNKLDNPGIDINKLSVSSKDLINWRCHECGYKWTSSVNGRVFLNNGVYSVRQCKSCIGLTRTKPYSEEYEILNKMYSAERNEKPFDNLFSSDNLKKQFWWECQNPNCMEIFPQRLDAMLRAAKTASSAMGCPFCAGKKVTRNKSFGVLHPDLLLDYAPENKWDPFEVTEHSNKPATWRCHKNKEHHAWTGTFTERANGFKNCPECVRIFPGRMLSDFRPDLKELFLAKNKKPFEAYTIKSNEKLELRCPKGHEFSRYIYNINETIGNISCPVCDCTVLVKGQNDFASQCDPAVLKRYDLSRNKRKPDELTIADNDRDTWWVCDKGHPFKRSVKDRIQDDSCPVCDYRVIIPGINSFAALNPKLAKEVSPDEPFNLDTIKPYKKYSPLWRCQKCGHDYRYEMNSRRLGDNVCPVCTGKRLCADINSLAVTNPELAAELDPNGGFNASELMETYAVEVSWICQTCHQSYRYPVRDRRVGDNVCPVCNGKRLCPDINSLAVTNPELAAELDPNCEYKATELMETYSIKALWVCPKCKQSYRYPVRDRVVGDHVCPVCNDRKVAPGINSFKIKHPDLMVEWDAIANYLLCNPDAVSDRDNTYVWWKCKHCGRPYRMSIKDRVMAQFRGHIACTHEKGRRFRRNYTILD